MCEVYPQKDSLIKMSDGRGLLDQDVTWERTPSKRRAHESERSTIRSEGCEYFNKEFYLRLLSVFLLSNLYTDSEK